MSQLAKFFKESDTRLGVFYPAHYIIATFPNLDDAEKAAAKLRTLGFSSDEVQPIRGPEFVELINGEKTAVGVVMKSVSHFIDTEANYTERDFKDAEDGAGILAAYCPDERAKREAWNVIASYSPIRARYYALSGVEHLAGEF